MLLEKVQEALSKGYTNQSLSLALGHNKKYISNALISSSERTKKTIVAKIDYLLNSTVIEDAIMVSKEEYESLKKELNHKNQVLDKRNDKYNMLEAELHETKERIGMKEQNCIELNKHTKKLEDINTKLNTQLFRLTNDIQDVNADNLKLKNDYHERASMHINAENQLKKDRKRYLVLLILLFIASLLSFVLSRV